MGGKFSFVVRGMQRSFVRTVDGGQVMTAICSPVKEDGKPDMRHEIRIDIPVGQGELLAGFRRDEERGHVTVAMFDISINAVVMEVKSTTTYAVGVMLGAWQRPR